MLRNLTIFYVEDFGGVGGLEDFGEVLPISVGDKDLSEIIGLDELYDAFDTFGVEAIEDIVEQQNGFCCIYHLSIYHLFIYWFIWTFRQVQTLCQFHREDKSPLLALGADLLEGIISETHFEVVFVNPL